MGYKWIDEPPTVLKGTEYYWYRKDKHDNNPIMVEIHWQGHRILGGKFCVNPEHLSGQWSSTPILKPEE